MIKLPKKLLIAIFFIILAISSVNLFYIISDYEDLYIYRYISSFFVGLSLCGLFLSIYMKGSYIGNYKRDSDLMKSPVLTLIILLVGTIVFSIFILSLINLEFEFQNKKILYWQISSLLFGILSIGLFINIHVKLVKRKSQNIITGHNRDGSD